MNFINKQNTLVARAKELRGSVTKENPVRKRFKMQNVVCNRISLAKDKGIQRTTNNAKKHKHENFVPFFC